MPVDWLSTLVLRLLWCYVDERVAFAFVILRRSATRHLYPPHVEPESLNYRLARLAQTGPLPAPRAILATVRPGSAHVLRPALPVARGPVSDYP